MQDDSTAKTRDIAAEDAHTALRSALMPRIRARPDSDEIVRRVAAGDELAIDYMPDARTFGASLIGVRATNIMLASLDDDQATNDLFDALGLALTAALNHEPPERRQALAALVTKGATFVCRLRILAGIESFVVALALDGNVVWKAERAQTFEASACLRPETTLH